MNSTSGGWINLLIVWAVASAVGFVAMTGLMLVAEWSLMQALFAAAVIFLALGTLLSVLFLSPLPGPQKPGTAGWDMAAGRPRSGAAAKASSSHSGSGHASPGKATAAQAGASVPATAPAAKPKEAIAPAAKPEVAAAAPAPAAEGPGKKPATLNTARAGGADDLKRIKGIGPKLEKLCHSLGFYHFDQIAAWTPEEIAWVDQNLEGFKGRVVRDDWVAQAKQLAAGG
jgi:predicted flap endonuclease-1-like 5' DNA nuclease